jgi:hypothetical protein
MAAFAVLAARLAFAMPRDLRANWIFRIVPVRSGPRYVAARRRALLLVSAAPILTGWAAILFLVWPWHAALGHVVALGLLSALFVEVALTGAQKIPFTCSYLPGRSQAHLIIPAVLLVLLPATIWFARFERDALQDPIAYTGILGVLGAAWTAARWRNAWVQDVTGAQPEFEDAPDDRLLALELWDARFKSLTRTRQDS